MSLAPFHSPFHRRAFTLIEIVIAVAILAILAGAAVPMASKFFNSRARADTRAELDEIAAAALEYFRDTGRLPTSVQVLGSDPTASGWAGPYLSVSTTEPWSGTSDVEVDAWAGAYVFQAQGASLLELRSPAEGGKLGDENDIVFSVDVTPIRREETLAQLDTLNRAIGLYNAQYLPDDPLSTKYSTLLSRLVSTGFLPAAVAYQVDGWGNAFVSDPAGKSPVVAVSSTSLASASASGGGSTAGKGKDKGKGKSGSSDGKSDGGKKSDSSSGGSKKNDSKTDAKKGGSGKTKS